VTPVTDLKDHLEGVINPLIGAQLVGSMGLIYFTNEFWWFPVLGTELKYFKKLVVNPAFCQSWRGETLPKTFSSKRRWMNHEPLGSVKISNVRESLWKIWVEYT